MHIFHLADAVYKSTIAAIEPGYSELPLVPARNV